LKEEEVPFVIEGGDHFDGYHKTRIHVWLDEDMEQSFRSDFYNFDTEISFLSLRVSDFNDISIFGDPSRGTSPPFNPLSERGVMGGTESPHLQIKRNMTDICVTPK
jgi:hypothetical protein